MRRSHLLLIGFALLMLGCLILALGAGLSMASSAQPGRASSLFVVVPVLLVVLFSLVIWIWALVHLLTNRTIESSEKLAWVVVVVFLNALGAVLYFLLAPSTTPPRRRRRRHPQPDALNAIPQQDLSHHNTP